MEQISTFEIFLAVQPGLEDSLCDEASAKGFAAPQTVPGGVVFQGTWRDVWRANLELRGAASILARFAEFRAMHLAQLDKRCRKIPWADLLRPDVPVKVIATCHKSRIYHAKAAAQRVEQAITATVGAPIAADAELTIKLRIDDDLATFSIDTSGAPLHRRGHKESVGKAPMRENMAALFLAQCGYTGQEQVLDPMSGSGTFVIEAAEIAMDLQPGRSRSFAFEQLAGFDPEAWKALHKTPAATPKTVQFTGSDRNLGAKNAGLENAKRAGVDDICDFHCHSISDATPPDGKPGLVIVNPPYGGRIGKKRDLFALYGAFGKTMKAQFGGWRIGLITSEPGLAHATDLPFKQPGPPISHGGLNIRLYQTGRLPLAK